MNNIEDPSAGGPKEKFPIYEEKFGHLAERIIRSALGKQDILIEKVEKGTDAEDFRQKVDFWIKIKNIDDPLGI